MKKSGSNMPHSTLFEYRAWPAEEMPHAEILHHLFGLGVAEARTDTYIFSSDRPQWMIVLHGGMELEILEKEGEVEPLSVWKTVARSAFPLRRGLVKTLMQAFPDADLAHRIVVPGDLISWLDRDTVMFTVSKRTVKFQRDACVAEISEVEAHGRRAETFSVSSKRADVVMEVLGLLPYPRLANMDYGSWLQECAWNAQPIEAAKSATIRMPATGTAKVA